MRFIIVALLLAVASAQTATCGMRNRESTLLQFLDPWCQVLCNHNPSAFCDSTPTSICTCDFTVPSQNVFYSRCAVVTDAQCDNWCNVIGTCHECCTTDATEAVPRFAAICPAFTDDWCTSYCNTDMILCEQQDCCVPADQADDIDGDGYVEYFDCNDNDASINPDAVDICDGIDNDCDGEIDEGFVCGLTFAPVASNLCSPRGLFFENDMMYIAETGLGGPDDCQVVRGENVCLGTSGRISTIDFAAAGAQAVYADSLPSTAIIHSDGSTSDPSGIVDIIIQSGEALALMGTVGPETPFDQLTPANPLFLNFSSILDIGTPNVNVASIWKSEESSDPDSEGYNSNPYSFALNPSNDDEVFVADAGANAIWKATLSTGVVELAVLLERVDQECIPDPCTMFPPFVCCSSNITTYSTQAVPTKIAFRPNHPTHLFIAKLTGIFWNAPASSLSYLNIDTGDLIAVEPFRFTAVVGLTFASEDSLYVLQYHPLTGQNTLNFVDLTSNTMSEISQSFSGAIALKWWNDSLFVSNVGTSTPSGDRADCVGQVIQSQ